MRKSYDKMEAMFDGTGGHLRIENLKFNKTGEEIADSLKTRVKETHTKIEKSKARIAELAKSRGVDPKEVIEAGNDSDKVNAYLTKASVNTVGNREVRPGGYSGIPQDIVESLEKDLHELRRLGTTVSYLADNIVADERVMKNISRTKTFELDYSELCELGF
jgi:translation initiation factor 2B subunit (eIF-2B alpha/beta/delta family)